MSEIFLSLSEAAELEGTTYNCIWKRIQKNKERFIVKKEKNPHGRKDLVFIALSSLSPKARRTYKKQNPTENELVLVEENTQRSVPWYAEEKFDFAWYKSNYKRQYEDAIKVVSSVKAFLDYDETDRTSFASEFAESMDISQRTLYRYAESYIEAEGIVAEKLKATGVGYEHYKVLAMCRKPKDSNTFPSLNVEHRAFIENVWFNVEFSENKGTVEMLYTQLEEFCKEKKMQYPSIKTVNRYIVYLIYDKRMKNTKQLATGGVREYKRNVMVKALRDTKAVPVLGIVQGDSHTFDFWVQYTDPNNGKTYPIRPTMVAWIDTRSRVVMGCVWAKNVNAQVVKQSVVKFIYENGVPRCILIDNGKDYTAEEMLGRKRNKRSGNGLLLLDDDAKGFYKSMGILDDYRTLPYQPWAKGPIERFFGTVCQQFSKWFGSYTGTLTGSKTSSKIKKDVDKLFAQGKLLTMEEAYAVWNVWLQEKYHKKAHSGLKRMHERWTAPMELFENAEERIELPPPAFELAEMLLLKGKIASVLPIGIKHNSHVYMNYALTDYINDKVNIRWDPSNMSKIYVYDLKNRKICEAECAELLQYNGLITEKNLLDHLKAQRKQLATDKKRLDYATTPLELRGHEGDPMITGKLNLMIEKKKASAIECAAEIVEIEESTQKSGNEYFEEKAKEVLKELRKINKGDF